MTLLSNSTGVRRLLLYLLSMITIVLLFPKLVSSAALNLAYATMTPVAFSQPIEENPLLFIGLRSIAKKEAIDKSTDVGFNYIGPAWTYRSNSYDGILQDAISYLDTGASFGIDLVRIERLLGRLLLMAGEPERAAEALEYVLGNSSTTNLLLWSELADAYHALGRFEDADRMYRKAEFVGRKDVFYATLPSSHQWRVSSTRSSECGRHDWGYALHDLLDLRERALGVNDLTLVAALEDQLRFFPLSSIAPSDDPCVNTLNTKAMSRLVDEHLWSQEILTRVMGLQVWRGEATSVEQMLLGLLEEDSANADLHFYLAETHHRSKRLEEAAQAYKQVIILEPDYTQAYLRLGMVVELVGRDKHDFEMFRKAMNSYLRYSEFVPDDSLNGKTIVRISSILGLDEQRNKWTRQLEKRDDMSMAAELLGTSKARVRLSENFVRNESFEWGRVQPEAWIQRIEVGGDHARGLAVSGIDQLISYDGNQSLRIQGVWRTGEGYLPGIGYHALSDSPIRLDARAWYLLSFYYKTSSYGEPIPRVRTRFHGGHVWQLPGTDGAWRKFGALVHAPATPLELPVTYLAVYNKGLGEVYFDLIGFRKILLPSETSISSDRANSFVIW